MALAAGDDKHQERFIYLVNGDGSVVCGRFIDLGDKGGVGWVPYTEAGLTKWVGVADSQVEFVSAYAGRNIMQVEDDDIWLDGAVFLNSIPAALAGGGTGTLWWLSGQTVAVMDDMRDLGDRYVIGGPTPTREASLLPGGFVYQSNRNDEWLSQDDLRRLIA